MDCSNEELTRLSDLIGLIYDGATEPEHWNVILPKVADWVGAKFGLLFTPLHPPEKGGFYFNHRIPESVMHLWSTRWHGQDVMANAVMEKGLFVEGRVLLGEEVMPYEQMQQAPIYRELNHPNQIDHFLIGAVFDFNSPNGLPMAINFYRSDQEGAFTPDERERLTIILPHVSRAFGVMVRLREADYKVAASLSALDRLATGVLLIDASGAVAFANRSAQRMLEDGDGLGLRKLTHGAGLGDLIADDAAASRAIGAAICATLNRDPYDTPHFSNCVTVPRSYGAASYTLQCSALGERNEFGGDTGAYAAIVFIADGAQEVEIDPALLQSAYGLTPAEAKVAVALIESSTAEQVATQLGTSPNTVRTQIKQIYAKLGVDTRARFVKLMMGLASHRS